MSALYESYRHLDVVLIHLEKTKALWGEVCSVIPKHRRRFAYAIMEDMRDTLYLIKDTIQGELQNAPAQKGKVQDTD